MWKRNGVIERERAREKEKERAREREETEKRDIEEREERGERERERESERPAQLRPFRRIPQSYGSPYLWPLVDVSEICRLFLEEQRAESAWNPLRIQSG